MKIVEANLCTLIVGPFRAKAWSENGYTDKNRSYFSKNYVVQQCYKSHRFREHDSNEKKKRNWADSKCPRLDFRRSLVSGLRSAVSFPEQRLVIEPINWLAYISQHYVICPTDLRLKRSLYTLTHCLLLPLLFSSWWWLHRVEWIQWMFCDMWRRC